MLHVTCDHCGKNMRPGYDHLYVVKIEVFAAHDPSEITEEDLDEDHMDAVGELIREMEDDLEDSDGVEPASQSFRFDLCPECRKRYANDPLGKEVAQKLHFSEN